MTKKIRMDDQQPIVPQQQYAQSPIYQDNSQDGKNAKWLWILIALIIVGALAFAFFRGIGPFAMLKGKPVPTPSPTPSSFFATPTPESTPGANIDKASAKIRVLNGNGQAGVASSGKAYVESKGYKVTAVGNADNFDFTDTVIKKLSNDREHLVFILWGKFAEKKEGLIDARKHLILKSAHPSPFSATKFFGNKHFSKTNEYLREHGRELIRWGEI